RDDTAQAGGVYRPGRGVRRGAMLDLDKGDDAAAPGDDIDLAARAAGTDGEDAIPLQAQPPAGCPLGPAAPCVRRRALHARPRPALPTATVTIYRPTCA